MSMATVDPHFPNLLTLTSNGLRETQPDFGVPMNPPGGQGRSDRSGTGGRNGSVVAVLPVTDDSEVLVTTQHGMTIRLAVAGIRAQGRNTLGVRVIRIEEDDRVRDAVVLPGSLENGTAVMDLPPSPPSPPTEEPTPNGGDGPEEDETEGVPDAEEEESEGEETSVDAPPEEP